MLKVGRVDGGWLDQRHRDRSLLGLQLHPEGVGKSLHRVLGSRVGALQWDSAVGYDAADVDQGSASGAKPRYRRPGSIHRPPEIYFEQPPHVFDRHFHQVSIERHPSVVYPGVDGAELLDRRGGQPLDVLLVSHVGHHGACHAATFFDGRNGFPELGLVARAQDHAGPPVRSALGGGQADAAGAAGDHHDLVFQPLQFDSHV
jgi:hypothetical protein